MIRTTLRVFFADQEEMVDNSSNGIRCTVNPLLTPPLPFGLFISNTFWGGGGLIETGRVLERKGLFDLVKIVVSALHEELECKVKSSIEEVEVHAAKGQKQIRPSNM